MLRGEVDRGHICKPRKQIWIFFCFIRKTIEQFETKKYHDLFFKKLILASV